MTNLTQLAVVSPVHRHRWGYQTVISGNKAFKQCSTDISDTPRGHDFHFHLREGDFMRADKNRTGLFSIPYPSPRPKTTDDIVAMT